MNLTPTQILYITLGIETLVRRLMTDITTMSDEDLQVKIANLEEAKAKEIDTIKARQGGG